MRTQHRSSCAGGLRFKSEGSSSNARSMAVLCCAALRWRFAVFFFFYGIFSYFPVREPKLIFRCDASIRSANVFFFSLQLFSHLLPSFVDLS